MSRLCTLCSSLHFSLASFLTSPVDISKVSPPESLAFSSARLQMASHWYLDSDVESLMPLPGWVPSRLCALMKRPFSSSPLVDPLEPLLRGCKVLVALTCPVTRLCARCPSASCPRRCCQFLWIWECSHWGGARGPGWGWPWCPSASPRLLLMPGPPLVMTSITARCIFPVTSPPGSR